MVEEKIDLIDENGKRTGKIIWKSTAHKKGLLHLAVAIWVYNSKGEVLIQKRAANKEFFPNHWDISAAGHVGAGENIKVSALRELKEEIGIEAKSRELKKFVVKKMSLADEKIGFYNNEFMHAYLYRFKGTIKELKLQKVEVKEIKFVPIKQLEAMIRNLEQFKEFVPHKKFFLETINTIKKELSKN
ncbi:MAG: NUDIX domain-containing protein [Nanoarchaeota archaeon]|nr:NUDIX domain-containing protein [Nanoarchaeota archaeon]MBU1029734.1 NUDIX domain-containing protein [Nanoarchaeota archaeon]MBU1849167.1 NUDIX domain-containing protein [Nanoarchaeota archaeon]